MRLDCSLLITLACSPLTARIYSQPVYGFMAVMTSPTFDKPLLDSKADALAPVHTDAMAIDTEANG